MYICNSNTAEVGKMKLMCVCESVFVFVEDNIKQVLLEGSL